MIEIGQRVQTGRIATESLCGRILDNSVSAYFSSLGDEDFPSTTDLEQAGVSRPLSSAERTSFEGASFRNLRPSSCDHECRINMLPSSDRGK